MVEVIELEMVGRMVKRGLNLAPILAAVLYVAGGLDYALSGLVGLAMTLGNLWMSARIIGGVAERSPKMLLPAGVATFMLGLLLLTGIAFVLQRAGWIDFPVTGFTLIGSHLLLVLWEGATGSKKGSAPGLPTTDPDFTSDNRTARARS